MTKKAEGWISRRGQTGAAAAVELVLERQPQEAVQQIDDTLIDDSPYQARQALDDGGIEELAQGMRMSGFQGVLIVRSHGEEPQRRQSRFQLVYGHRRRAAWRRVCAERGETCRLPVVVRDVNDAELLTIGAQENLQRQDLNPVEEAQIVAWAERMFFEKNQAELGALLGKSADWVSTRSRIHRLPEPIKEMLRQRPRAIKQALELGALAVRDADAVGILAERVVQENLTVEQLRRFAAIAKAAHDDAREAKHNQRAGAAIVPDVTGAISPGDQCTIAGSSTERDGHSLSQRLHSQATHSTNPTLTVTDLVSSLHEAASALQAIERQPLRLPRTTAVMEALASAERAIASIRQAINGLS